MQIREIPEREFINFQKNFPIISFVQSPENQRIMQEQGSETFLLGFFEQKKMLGAGLFTIKKVLKILKFAHCNQGPLLLTELENSPQEVAQIIAALRKFFARKNVFKVILTPNLELNQRDIDGEIVAKNINQKWLKTFANAGLKWEKPSGELINGVGRFFFAKDLRDIKNEADLLKSFDQKTRNLVRKSEKMQVEIREISDKKDLLIFKKIMESTAARRGFRDRNLCYYESLQKNFAERAKIFLAGVDPKKARAKIAEDLRRKKHERENFAKKFPDFARDKKLKNQSKILDEEIAILEKREREILELKTEKFVPMSAAIFLNYGGEVTYLFSGSYAKYMQFAASYAVQFAAQKWAIKCGAKTYNFYGTTGKFSGSSDDGVYVFKKGFGGKVVEQVGNFEIIARPAANLLYKFANFLRGR